ncbi:hypothetical protein SEA_VORVOLAKOS_44 [Streptomyces phage Vorvolakos]|nr:hypothetical protein SEA_VORVOLAKOS_44 [Streptomyces phage Vorvolakos]
MATRYYSSVAAETTLVASITNGNTSIQIASATGLPALTPFTLALDYEAATEELVEVTAVAGTTLTVTRGIDGTSAASHNAGARVRHVSSARDFADSRTHESTATNVHGTAVGSAVVGTNDTQTLSNKTLNDATGTLSNIDIFANSPTWVTTVNADIAGTADIMKWLRDSSEPHEVAKITNNGALFLRNQNVAADSALSTYRLRITKDNGTTDIFSVLSGGTITPWTDAGQSGLQVKPRTTNNDVAIRVRNSTDTADTFAAWNNGRVDINGTDPAFSQLDVHGASGQTAACMRVMNNDESVTHFTVAGNGAASFGSSLTVAGAQTNNGLIVANAGIDVTGNATVSGTLSVTGQTSASGTSVITAAAGFSVDAATQAVIKGGWIIVTGVLLRTGGTLTASATGNLTDTALCTIASTYRPDSVFGSDRMVTSFGTGFTSGGVGLNPSTGAVELLDAHSTSTIDTGHTVRFTYVYPQ